MTRRSFAKGAVAAAGAAVATGMGGTLVSAARPADDRGDADRATAAYQAMQKQYYLPDVSLYRPTVPMSGDNPYSYVWPFGQAMAATLDMLGLPGAGTRYAADVQDRVKGLAHYWNPTPTSHNPPSPPAPPSPPGYASYVIPPLGGGGDIFYDDNEWIGLASIQQYRMTGDSAALERAKAIFTLVRYGWDDDASHPDPGGTYWTMAPWSHDRNTISNGPGAELGLHLFSITKDKSYLDHSILMFDWANKYMLAPNGLYWDHVDVAGTVEKTQWSYNQGVMLGAAALLYRATGTRSYLDQATTLAQRALDFYQQGGRLYTQDVIFNAIFFKNLLLLSAVRPNPRYRSAMQSYADTLAQAVDGSTGILAVQPYNPVDLLVQSGYVQLQALLAWDPKDYELLA